MSLQIPVRFYLDAEVDAELLDELDLEYTYEDDYCVVTMELSEELIESLQADELLEFIGLNAESLVYIDTEIA